ncbi:hypothetical protein F4778DRAFT_798019 [Xylariomycetidae sp. FL2044]|nr:hypothetical protein F4778DRAFT_798019 [Xylariomycetidae sp. FL2044]
MEFQICQQLPKDWIIFNEAEFAKPASKNILLDRSIGIEVPVQIKSTWLCICYFNPKHDDTDRPNPITVMNPTCDYDILYKAMDLLSKWIPKGAEWLPGCVSMDTVKVIECQRSSRYDSGIHVSLGVIYMAKYGKPEGRRLDNAACKALRVRYFDSLFRSKQVAAHKASVKAFETGIWDTNEIYCD